MAAWSTNKRGIVSVVTGGGKTVFALMCLLEFAREYPLGKAIVIVPTLALLDQWYVSLQDALGLKEDSIAVYSGEEKPEAARAVNLLVINTARETAPAIAEAHDTFLIVDECHRAGSTVNAHALQGTHQATLGLSATPERQYDTGFEDYIVPSLGPIIYEYDYEQAYKEGVITAFNLVNVRVPLLPDEQNKVDRLTQRIARTFEKTQIDPSYQERLKHLLLQRAALVGTATMRIPVASKIVDMNRGERTLLFHERIDAANNIVEVLRNRHHAVTVYHSDIGPHLRRSNLRLYRRGIFDILVTCRALDEGFDVPETTVAVIASSTASSRQRIQRLGRVLRPAPGKQSATIYTIYASDYEEERLIEEARHLEAVTSVTWQRSSGKNWRLL